MSKIIIELKVIEIHDEIKDTYGKVAVPERPEENKIRLEVDNYEKAEQKVAVFFKMLGL